MTMYGPVAAAVIPLCDLEHMKSILLMRTEIKCPNGQLPRALPSPGQTIFRIFLHSPGIGPFWYIARNCHVSLNWHVDLGGASFAPKNT